MNLIKSESDVDSLRRSAAAWAVIGAWSKAGAFAALADGRPRPLSELPGDTRALTATAHMLAHLGLLAGDGTTWALSHAGLALWESGVLKNLSAEGLLGDYARLDAVIRDGGPARAADGSSRVTEGGVREHDREQTRGFLDMLHRRSAGAASEVARFVSPRLAAGAHVLDLGGGHGRYARELVSSGYRVTLYDKPVVVELARERYDDALEYRSGDFHADDLGGPYDAVLLSNVVHCIGVEQARGLLVRVIATLRPGGLVVLKDLFTDDLGSHPEEAVFFGMTMLLYTREGRCYTAREMDALCAEVGLVGRERVMVPDCGFSLVIGRTPGFAKGVAPLGQTSN